MMHSAASNRMQANTSLFPCQYGYSPYSQDYRFHQPKLEMPEQPSWSRYDYMNQLAYTPNDDMNSLPASTSNDIPPYYQTASEPPSISGYSENPTRYYDPYTSRHEPDPLAIDVKQEAPSYTSPTSSPSTLSTQNRGPYAWLGSKRETATPDSEMDIAERPHSWHQGKTRTKEKYRVVYTDQQRVELEREYVNSRYITIKRKTELASELNLSERQVKIWFQNRRAKERKLEKKRTVEKDKVPRPMFQTDGNPMRSHRDMYHAHHIHTPYSHFPSSLEMGVSAMHSHLGVD